MREIIEIIILGIVQGLTEFLPVSSSGHLLLLQEIFGLTENTLFVTIILHLGTLVAVVIYYFKDLVSLLKPENHKTIWWLIIATLPAVIVGFTLGDLFENATGSKLLAFTFLFTAIILILGERLNKKYTLKGEFNSRSALAMGLFQCIALTPGISRSGSTIFGGIVTKKQPNTIAKFSFFMSIPIILGSLILELFKVELVSINWLALIFGFISSLASGLLAIKLMIKVIGRCNFKWFSLYLTILSFVCFIQNFIYPIW